MSDLLMNLKMSIPLAISCAKCKNLEPRESEYTEAEFFCLEKKEFILTPELTTCRQRRRFFQTSRYHSCERLVNTIRKAMRNHEREMPAHCYKREAK